MSENLIPNIIYELFENNKKIVIDGLGYFEVTHQSASYDTESKTLYPPKTFLHFQNIGVESDNILVKNVAEKLNISEDEAYEKISLWIDDVCMQLAEFQRIAFGEKGEFFINDEGKISFCFLDKTNILKNNYGLKNVHLKK
ncbi:MAG: hypothetical protein LBT56_00200 [Prevotellaceae bacterium]|jgi:nucleoid DNA-binding protein|nr:hypothetical protein [Prevotellaceae bacterium]